MTRRELLKLCLESGLDDGEKLYNRPGLDNICRIFLHCIKENQHHKRRRELFQEYSGYRPQY